MKPAAFEYTRAATVEEALGLLGDGADARPLAGGQSLVPAMNFRLVAPSRLVDLNGVTELAGITEQPDGSVRIGAMTRHREVERSPLIACRAPLLAQALPHVAHVAIRNRGTLGGSLANADPAAEIPAALLTLGARYHLCSATGERTVAACDFHLGLLETALREDELLVAAEIPPRPAGERCAFEEVARRPGDYALLGVAVQVVVDEQGECHAARLGYLSAGAHALLAPTAAAALVGTRLDENAIEAAAEAAAEQDLNPTADLQASVSYRRQLARVLTRRALKRAGDRSV